MKRFWIDSSRRSVTWSDCLSVSMSPTTRKRNNKKRKRQHFLFFSNKERKNEPSTLNTMPSLNNTTTATEFVKQALHEALAKNDNDESFTAVDLLREFRRQSELLGETARIRELLTSDPFEQWNDDNKLVAKMARLGERLQVVDVHRVITLSGYSFIDAVVEIPAANDQQQQHVNGKIKKKKKMTSMRNNSTTTKDDDDTTTRQLLFRYERRAQEARRRIEPGIDPPTVWYSIDLSNGGQPVERLLWVQVWADGHTRAEHLTAVNLDDSKDDDDDDDWEDIDDDEDATRQEQKRQRMDEDLIQADVEMKSNNEATDSSKDDERADRYVAGMDPDVLQSFLQWIQLGDACCSEVTAFFLLMTFPFFEHEWDLIGYVLESVFGSESDDDDDNIVHKH